MKVTVQLDKILIGTPDFVPRFLDLPTKLQVLPGQTVELSGVTDVDYIEVGGTLKVPRTGDVTLRFLHFFILPGGFFDCGSEDDPVTGKVELVVKDKPLDLARDPFQWGNGLLNFGRREMCGVPKVAWGRATTGLSAGATTVTLDRDPEGWQAGDHLLITETRIVPAAIPRGLEPFPNREGLIKVLSVAGRVVTFDAGLQFDHLPLVDPKGQDVAYPRIANLTRNIVLRSEAAAVTPGHLADVGMDAMWCDCYFEDLQLGRTKNVVLNDIDPVTLQPGTNQKGRYSNHKHHAMGLGSLTKGIVMRGVGEKVGPKWGLAVHNVHDGIFEDNIAIDFPGAGFVTEDGNEVRNVFRGNFAAYCRGTHDGTPGAESSAIKVTNPGATGNGYFFRGVKNYFEGNEAWNNFIGCDLFTQEIGSFAPLFYPSVPGGPVDTRLLLEDNLPITFADNIGNSNAVTGLEFWFVTEFVAVRSQLAYNGQFQFLQGTSNPAAPNFLNVDCVGDSGQTFGMTSSLAYAQKMKIVAGRIVGCEIGIPDGGANASVDLDRVHFQNALDIDYRDLPQTTTHTDCVHEPLPGRPAHYIQFGRAGTWDGTGTPPVTGVSVWRAQHGSTQYIKNWQGDGKSYQLLTEQQLGSLPAVYSSNPPAQMAHNTPLAGVTVKESWDALGMAPYGDMVDDAAAVRKDGVPLGFFREGERSVLGPPRFPITSPTHRQPAFTFVQDGSPDRMIRLYGVLTGDGGGISRNILMSVNGEPPLLWLPNPSIIGADDFTMTQPAPNGGAEGVYQVKTWRTDGVGLAIPSTEMTFEFTVGPVVTPPTPPPPAPTVDAPIIEDAVHVTGGGRAGASVAVLVDGVPAGSGLVGTTLTVFDVQVPALVRGQRVTATQTLGTLTSSASAPVIVTAPIVPPPVETWTVVGTIEQSGLKVRVCSGGVCWALGPTPGGGHEH